jgi:FtsP/CotA-like multicopper oxidase with cupredoxin domain
MTRRDLLASLPPLALSARAIAAAPADYTLRIAPAAIEIAPKRFIKTTAYNGIVPGPVLRMREGRPVSIELFNDSTIPEIVHWHGLFSPPDVDGSAEEGTPFLTPRANRRIELVPHPSGTRWYHSHIYAGRDLNRSTYTGQFGFLLVDDGRDPGRYDRDLLLALHGWRPFLGGKQGGGEGDDSSLEVGYNAYTVNSHMLGAGEPIRVKQGERLLARILNANATEVHRLALPGHRFQVIALDGNPVPSPQPVGVLELAPAERADVIIEMDHPGVWILGDVDGRMRRLGLGTVVEYAGRSGEPQWIAPPSEPWDYTRFGTAASMARPSAEAIPLVFKSKWAGNRWVEHWTINGKEFPKTDPIRVRANGRYRLIFDNQSDDMHPVHLHRHTFELVSVAGKPTAGVRKDVVSVPPRSKTEVELIAANPGPTLFHCHMQLHMDFGFMAMMEYVS